VARLSLLRELVERGHSIGTVATLPDDQLHRRLIDAPPAPATQRKCRLAVVGAALTRRLDATLAALPQIEVAGRHATLKSLNTHAASGSLDAILVDVPTLRPVQVPPLLDLLQTLRPRLLVVVYGFAAGRDLQRLDLERVMLLRGPVDPAQILRICLLSLNMPSGPAATSEFDRLLHQPVPGRRYSERQLAAFATSPNAIRCECPRHLADLLNSLDAFELYSTECASADAEDAALHLMLSSVAGHARGMLEEALRRVNAAKSQHPVRALRRPRFNAPSAESR
jgi:hypothetical protein